VRRRVAVLHAPVVAAPEEDSGGVEQSAADGDAALAQPGARFLDRLLEQIRVVHQALRMLRDARAAA
jgi:hypothetical protein